MNYIAYILTILVNIPGVIGGSQFSSFSMGVAVGILIASLITDIVRKR